MALFSSSTTAKDVLKIFATHARQYPWIILCILLTISLSVIFQLFTPLYYKDLIDTLLKLTPNTQASTIKPLLEILFWIFLTQFGAFIMLRIASFVNAFFQTRVMTDLEQTCFRYLMGHSYQFFLDSFTGSLVRKVNRLTRAFEDISDSFQWQLLPITITTGGILFVLWRKYPWLALTLFAWIILFVLVNYAIAKWKLKYDEPRAAADSVKTGYLADGITNNINIKLFQSDTFEDKGFIKKSEEALKITLLSWNISEINNMVQAFLMLAINIGLFYLAIRLWSQGKFSIGDFVLLETYLLGLFDKLWDFGRVIRNFFSSFADAKEMTEILKMPYDIQDARQAKPLMLTKGKIEFQDVTFTYHKTRPVLKEFNLKIKPHEKVGLVGPSGAGKSTIVKLLFRFYDIDRGRILIDDQNITRVTQHSLREQIALVPQEPMLFHRTLMDNIRYGKRDATDKEVIEAAKKARCHEFIKELPDGYQTFVGERGIKLSGGERQRVAIARAILKDAPILLLDEATSSLDSESEALIQSALHELMKDKTAIAIAHRLSTIMEMDRIVVMDKGQVMDSGTHESLLKKTGIYKTLWEIQAGGFLP
ncbi:ABC transporter ATP-binding protein [Candidatus Uhrbacteria bacterium]|nr:ABC transporter ATP-binding protein [Candidatus Uhrbacteria bacterium]